MKIIYSVEEATKDLNHLIGTVKATKTPVFISKQGDAVVVLDYSDYQSLLISCKNLLGSDVFDDEVPY